jgi:LSD1 subclass zinc finger protein
MLIRNVFLTFSLAIIFAVAVGALIIDSSLNVKDTARVVNQETSLQDGASLLNIRCAQCHTVELIKQTNQTRAEWENTLAQMEKMGVTLSNDEKIVLIDYLTGVDKP